MQILRFTLNFAFDQDLVRDLIIISVDTWQIPEADNNNKQNSYLRGGGGEPTEIIINQIKFSGSLTQLISNIANGFG